MRIETCLLAALALAAPAAAQLELTLAGTLDVSALNMYGFGGASFDPNTGSLWLSDAYGTGGAPPNGTNAVFEVDPATGMILSSFSASVVPGLDIGPDALAVHPTTGDLFLFSVYNDDEAGSATQSGALVNEFLGASFAPASGFSSAGELFIVSDSIFTAGDLHRVNQTTGAIETSTPIAYSGRVPSLDFDPLSGNLFLYLDDGDDLLEVNPATGAILSVTDLSPWIPIAASFPTAIAFSPNGDRLYVGKGIAANADAMYVFDRGSLGTIYCTPAVVNSSGAPGRIVALGSDTVTDAHFTLAAYQLPPGQFGYFLVSAAQGAFTPPGSVGVLCVTGNIGRFNGPGQIITGPIDAMDVDLGALPVNPTAPVQAGDTWNFQCWFRDLGPTSNFTDAVSIVFN